MRLRLLLFSAILLLVSAASISSSSAIPSVIPSPTSSVSYTATLLVPANAYSSPGKGTVVAHLSTHALIYHGANTLLVLGSAEVGGNQYLKLRLDQRPNTSAGWVNINDLYVQADPYRLVVSISSRSLAVYKNGRLYARTRAVVGAVTTPTPLGLFAISEDVPQPAGSDLGSYVATLTAHSNFLKTFDGGDGNVGIHGYELLGAPLGTRSSHGCIRVPESFVRLVIGLPEGTPVVVQS